MLFSNYFSILAAAVFTLVSAEAYSSPALSGPAPVSEFHARAAHIFNRQNVQDCGNGQHCTNSICCGDINCMPADAQCCINGQYCLSGGTCYVDGTTMRCQHPDGSFVDSGSESPTSTPAPKSAAGKVMVGGMARGIVGVAVGVVLLL